MKTRRTSITKKTAPLDTWTAESLNEFDRLGLRTPTAKECRDAYGVGESPETWAEKRHGDARADEDSIRSVRGQ